MLVLVGCSPTSVTNYPTHDGYVTDTADVLTPEEEQQLEDVLKELDPLMQVAVVTVKSTSPQSVEEYAINIGNTWGVGHSTATEGAAITDNGVVFLLAVEDRKVRIEVGSGAEAYITDAEAGRILDEEVIPHLKLNKWNEGLKAGVVAIAKSI